MEFLVGVSTRGCVCTQRRPGPNVGGLGGPLWRAYPLREGKKHQVCGDQTRAVGFGGGGLEGFKTGRGGTKLSEAFKATLLAVRRVA